MSQSRDIDSSYSVAQTVKDNVKEFYGKTIQKTSDLQMDMCPLKKREIPVFMEQALSEIHHEVTSR